MRKTKKYSTSDYQHGSPLRYHSSRLVTHRHASSLPRQDRLLLYRALANLLLLPWLRAGDQLWDQRRRHLSVFLDSLTAEFRRLPRTPGLADSAELQNRGMPAGTE